MYASTLDHPSKGQLKGIISRYFYCPGWRTTIDTVTDYCHQCASMKTLPKVLLDDTSTPPSGFASNFAADIIERETQKILVVRECVTQFTRGVIVPDQKKDTLRQALLQLILDIMPDSGTHIRLDGASAFQSLEIESLTNDTLLHKLGIKIVIGRTMNKNKNPIAENTVKEIQKEILRLKHSPGPITPTELMLVLKNVNSRVRQNSLTPKEMLYRRDILSSQPINIDDDNIISKQTERRKKSSEASNKHKSKFKKKTEHQSFNLGDLVMLREGHNKAKPRDTFIVDSLPEDENGFILIRKLSQSLRPKLYKVLPQDLVHVPTDKRYATNMKRRKAAVLANEKIKSCLNITIPSKKFKYRWNEEDQLEEDYQLPLSYTNHEFSPIPITPNIEHEELNAFLPTMSDTLRLDSSSIGSCSSSDSSS